MAIYLPFVSVLTPVYNGEKYLAECIESVLNQDYKNWEYILVNNRSTDSTLDIVSRYAAIDARIRVISNPTFVGVIENHNIALSLISTESKYCKVVSADDSIGPNCVRKLVELAEAHPTVGIVGSYQRSDETVRWKGLPTDVEVISGRRVCRLTFTENLDVFGNPTSNLYRSDLVRKNKPFFPHSLPHADTSACYKYLEDSDFGFVHEILSTQRVHDEQVSSKLRKLNMGVVGSFHNLLEYGPSYLSKRELETLTNEFLTGYYRGLGGCVLKLKGKEFWQYHRSRMRELGYPIQWRRVIMGAMEEFMDEIQNPRVALRKLVIAIRESYSAL